MIRILMVDNEPYVVDWVASLLESQLAEDVDVCRAYMASEALEWLGRTRIDLVISDICMPKMSGLELADQVKKRWPFAKVILITAYAQLDYAVSAIRSNVAGYILKSQSDEDIIGEVKRVIALIREEDSAQSFTEQTDHIRDYIPLLQNQFFRRLLTNPDQDASAVEAQIRQLKLNLTAEKSALLIVSKVKKWEYENDLILKHQSFLKLKTLMENYAGDLGEIYAAEMDDSHIAWILQNRELPDEQFEKGVIQGRLEKLQNVYETAGEDKVSFFIYSRPVPLLRLRAAYRILEKHVNKMAWEQDSFVLASDEATDTNSDIETISEEMHRLLYEGRFEQVLQAISRYQQLENDKNLNEQAGYRIYYAVAFQFYTFLEEYDVLTGEQIERWKRNLFVPAEANQWGKKFQKLYDYAKEAFAQEKELKKDASETIVNTVIEYILSHLAEDVSLTRLSEIAGYNSCYLSRIFRDHTGTTISEFIGSRKMEYIRQLMTESNLNIGEISERSGFCSRTYFNRFVRKHTGMSPKDYRQKLRTVV